MHVNSSEQSYNYCFLHPCHNFVYKYTFPFFRLEQDIVRQGIFEVLKFRGSPKWPKFVISMAFDFHGFYHTCSKIYVICNQICQKGSYTRTVSKHTFHPHLLATSMHQQDMCFLLLKVEQSAFTQAFFSSLSGVHKCSGSL